MDMSGRFGASEDLAAALRRVGDLLDARDEAWSIVIVGGAALNLPGMVARPTVDVGVLAIGRSPAGALEAAPEPLPGALAQAAREVARDLRLPGEWLNSNAAGQGKLGLPAGFQDQIHWRQFGSLAAGIVDGLDLIHLKLYAACDDTGPSSRHFSDLLQLAPSDDELVRAGAWVAEQDSALETIIPRVLASVQSRRP